MKTDLITSIGIAIFGVLVSYAVCNLFLGEPESFSVKKLDNTASADLAAPDENIFNYKAIDPTVEVYVGNCKKFDQNGECIDQDNSTDSDNNNGGSAENAEESQ
ncbi:hypothetical protein IKF92_01815 [Candidatus Saccharibacteria bacterium]|nr:hypothetical protein [Candidatus Saccharibacteria bacterium]